MKKILFGFAALTLIVLGACKKEAKPVGDDRGLQAGIVPCSDTVVLPSVISGPRLLDSDSIYILNGKTYVSGTGVLTIQPGTRIEGRRKATPAEASALVVTRGGKIIANGDSCNPIVFTARIDSGNPTADPGDWGGVVILGNATVNRVNPVIEGIDLPTLPPGISVTYGGNNDTDSSGVMEFVRIEYAGAVLTSNRELNGLTLGGVGSRTVLHHIECAWGADDAFEFFGGTVNAKYLVALDMNDDGLDFDFGYRGAIQFALVVRSRCCFNQIYADANGIECDNDETCAPGAAPTPRTRPILSNITIVGGSSVLSGTLNGVRFRRNTDYVMRNSIIEGYNNGVAFELCSPSDGFPSKTPFEFNLLQGFVTAYTTASPAIPASNVDLVDPDGNVFGLNAPFTCGSNGTGLNYSPATGSIAEGSSADFTTRWPSDILASSNNSLNKSVTYVGAFPVNNKNWLACWSRCAGWEAPASGCQ
jgi:hypothetical protein